MSGEIASLGIAVQTGEVTKASTELEKLVQVGEKAEKAAEGISEGFGKVSAAASGLSGDEAKLAETTEDAKVRLLAMAKASLDSSEYLKSLASSVNTNTAAMDAARATTTDFAALNRRLKADADALVGTVDQQAQSTRQAAAATGVQADGLAKLLGQINPAVAALGRLDEQQAKLEHYRKAGLIDAETFKDYSTRIDSTRKSLGGFDDGLSKTGLSAKQTEAALRQLPAQFTDIFTSLAGGQNPLMVLIQQGGQIKDSFGGVDNTLTVLKDKFRSLFSGGSGAADLGASLAGMAVNSQDLAESAGEAGESLSDLAESSNTAAEAAENAQKAVGAISPAMSGVTLGAAGMALAVLAAAAAVGVLIYGYSQGSKEADEYNKALILTGNYAGTSAGQLADLALQVSATNGTIGDAAAILAKLAGSGVIASSSFKEIADAASAMEDATGRSVDATITEFVKIAKDPVAAAKELNDQYHFLTASVYSQIVALKEQGDTTAATDLLTKTYAETVQDRSRQITDNLGTIERAWKGIKDAAAGALDATLNIGRVLTMEQQAQVIRDRLATNQGRRGRAAAFGLETRDTAKDRAALAYLELQIDAEKAKSTYLGEQRKIQDDSLSAMIKVDALTKSSWTNEQKRTEALKEYRKQLEAIRKANPDDARLNQSVIDKNIANINARFKDPKGSSTGAVDLTEFNASQNAIKAILAEYANAQKELDALQKAGLVSQEEYGWKRAGLIGNEKDEITNAYEAEIAALESAKARKTTSAAQAIELDKKIADARTDMVKAQQDADSKLKVLATAEKGRLDQLRIASEAYVTQLERQRSALDNSGTRAAAALGFGGRQAGLQSDLDGVTDKFNDERAKLLDRRKTAPDKYSEEDYKRDLGSLEAAENKYRDTVVGNYDKISEAQGNWRSGATSAFENYLESARDISGQTKSLFTNAFGSMEDAIVNFALTGKLSFADFTKSILADMARIAARQASSSLLSSLVGAASGYFTGGGGNGMAAGSAGATSSNLGASQAGYSSAYFQANGGAWDSGVQLFADGGAFTNSIVSKPTAFGMAGGKTGVMGEAGEEAIMPLARTAGGKLGVMVVGGSGGGTSVSLSMPIMVMTDEESGRPEGAELDAEAFQRNMQERMRAVAKEEIAKSWRQGGVSSRKVKG